MYIQKIILRQIVRIIGENTRNNKKLMSSLANRYPEVWKPHLINISSDATGHMLEPFDLFWLGQYATKAADCVRRIKEILTAKSSNETKPLVPIEMSFSKQELLEIAKILKVRISKGANQWDVSTEIAMKIIKEHRKLIKKLAQKSRFLLTRK